MWRSPAEPAPSLPEGLRLYAVGDIHGQADLLRQLLERIRSWRIGIDTGAYATGVLTALGLEQSYRWLLQTVKPEVATG